MYEQQQAFTIVSLRLPVLALERIEALAVKRGIVIGRGRPNLSQALALATMTGLEVLEHQQAAGSTQATNAQ